MLGCPTAVIEGAPVRELAPVQAKLSQPFSSVCATCHGARGEGLKGYPAIPGMLTLAEYKALVRSGKKAMPAFSSEFYSDAQLEQDYAALQGGLEPSSANATAPVWDAARTEQAYRDGLVAFRKPDPEGAACASCHSPDGIDLAAIAYTDAAILRRALKHLEPDDANRVVDFIHAQRLRFGIAQPCSTLWRPFQPGGEVLPGQSVAEQDDALAAELVRRGSFVATGWVATHADAQRAFDELLALDLRQLPIGVPLPRWTEDGFNGPEHHSLNDWIPSSPRRLRSGATEQMYELDDRYLAEPTLDNLRAIDEAIEQPEHMVGPAHPFFDHVMSIKWRSVLLASHFFRMALTGKPGWFEAQRVPFPELKRLYNPFFQQGVRSKEGVLCAGGCDAAVTSLPADARAELHGAANAEAQINAFSDELGHPWFTLGQLFDQALLQTENGSDGTTLNPFYWNLNRFPHDQVHKPLFNTHRLVQQVHYLTEMRETASFPAQLSDKAVPPAVHPLLSGKWLIVEGLADPLRGLSARTATSIRLRINLLRTILLLQQDLLAAGARVEEPASLLDRLADWRTTPEKFADLITDFPELEGDRHLLTSETLALIDDVRNLVSAAPQ
jgi:mono/diheme cytochrome c family protein